MNIERPPEPARDVPEALAALGWDAGRHRGFAEHAAAGDIPGRVTSAGGETMALTEHGTVGVTVSGAFRHAMADKSDLPAVGDWLALARRSGDDTTAALRAVLPRTGTFKRERPIDGSTQVIAANVDLAFIVAGLDHDLNVRRIERYLVLATDGGIEPVILLNKADLVPDPAPSVAAVADVAGGARIFTVSAATGQGLDDVRQLLGVGVTVCLLGSSGVGKSRLTNALLGVERQAVRALREDDSKGRHTTTRGELFQVHGGALLIDTPGLRSVGIRGDAASIEAAFADVSALALACRFSDCRHQTEPGCAVRSAIEDGSLPEARLDSHDKLEAERRAFEMRADERTRRQHERSLSKEYSRHGRDKKRLSGR